MKSTAEPHVWYKYKFPLTWQGKAKHAHAMLWRRQYKRNQYTTRAMFAHKFKLAFYEQISMIPLAKPRNTNVKLSLATHLSKPNNTWGATSVVHALVWYC